MTFLKQLKWAWYDFKEVDFPVWQCKVFGHKGPFVKKFGGELLCRRCSAQVGRWSK